MVYVNGEVAASGSRARSWPRSSAAFGNPDPGCSHGRDDFTVLVAKLHVKTVSKISVEKIARASRRLRRCAA